MPRFEVQPEQLGSAGARQGEIAGRIGELGAQLDAAAVEAAGGAGEADARQALSDFGMSWSTALAQLAASVEQLGQNLGAAGAAYQGTDSSAMPAGRR